MDFVDGIDLSKLIKLNGPMDTASACEVIRQAALGLQYAHEHGQIHRDVKPSILMIEVSPSVGWTFLSVDTRDGQECPSYENKARVKLLDLGLALFGAASEAVDELTTVGQLMGTLDYMAPEQADNSHDVDARADVYSLGATLFKLLTRTAPYETPDRRSPLQKMKALATVDAPSVKTRSLPDDVAAVVDRLLFPTWHTVPCSCAKVAITLRVMSPITSPPQPKPLSPITWSRCASQPKFFQLRLQLSLPDVHPGGSSRGA